MEIEKDLSLLTKEPLVLKFSDDMKFTIPSDPTLEFTYQLVNFEEKVKKAKTNADQMDLFIEMATMILNQDESNQVDREFVMKKMHLSQMKAIVELYQRQAMENNENPN